MDLYEYQGKGLFAAAGIPVAHSWLAHDVDEAVPLAEAAGYPLVVKAQVLTGGRGKAGGVKVVGSTAELRAAVRSIIGMTIKGHVVHSVLLEQAVQVERELYLAITLDRRARRPLLLFSTRGGMDIEQVAAETPQALLHLPIDGLIGLQEFQIGRLLRQAAAAPGTEQSAVDELLTADVRRQLAAVVRQLWRLYQERDALLVEINPLVIARLAAPAGVSQPATPSQDAALQVLALDAKVSLDGNALYRQPDLAVMNGADDEREARAKQAGLNYVTLDGEVGVIGNGAGLVMSTLDLIAAAGGRAANFCDIGGGAKAAQIAAALDIIASNEGVRSVLVTIFGGITRADEVARGLLDGLEQSGVRLPIVVRLDGTMASEGRALIAAAGKANVTAATTADEAVELAVQRAASSAGRQPSVGGSGMPDRVEHGA
ncbi:MAG: ADP-forming succinate--CoA ligase subunit beta [Thermoleophilia bacterium]